MTSLRRPSPTARRRGILHGLAAALGLVLVTLVPATTTEASAGGSTTIGPRGTTTVSTPRKGTYRIGGLPPGIYEVRYVEQTRPGAALCFDGVPADLVADDPCSSAAPVTVTAGQATTLAPQQVADNRTYARIEGQLTGYDDSTIGNGAVEVYTAGERKVVATRRRGAHVRDGDVPHRARRRAAGLRPRAPLQRLRRPDVSTARRVEGPRFRQDPHRRSSKRITSRTPTPPHRKTDHDAHPHSISGGLSLYRITSSGKANRTTYLGRSAMPGHLTLVSGRVTNAATGAGVANQWVEIRRPGDTRLRFGGTTDSTGRWHRRRPSIIGRLAGALALALVVVTVQTMPATADERFYVTFRPLTPSGNELAGMRLDVFNAEGERVSARTSSYFYVDHEVHGERELTYRMSDPRGARQSVTLGPMTIAEPPRGAPRPEVVFRMPVASPVRGKVQVPAGDATRPAQGMRVIAKGEAATFSVLTSTKGAYRLGGLPPGTYSVRVDDPSGTYRPSTAVSVTLKPTNLRTMETVVLQTLP